MSEAAEDARTRLTGWVLVAGQLAILGAIAREVVRGRRRGPLRVAVAAALIGAGMAALGGGSLAMRGQLTAHPAPTSGTTLRTGGPYGVVRHPIYSGLMLCAGGAAILAGTRRAWVLAACLVLLFQGKARFEERLLATRFPEYRAYARRTPRFIPRPARPR